MTDQIDGTVLPIRRPPVKKVVFDVGPHPDGKDELALRAHAQQAHTARGINA
jgi:hypothetical protein